MGPLLYVLYTVEMADLAAKYGFKLHAFADDNHFMSITTSAMSSSVKTLEQCITAISQWMSANRLKLNVDKTELMWAATKYTVASLLHDRDLNLTIGTDTVAVADALRVLMFSLHWTSHMRSTQRRLARSVSISCDAYDAHLIVTVQLY